LLRGSQFVWLGILTFLQHAKAPPLTWQSLIQLLSDLATRIFELFEGPTCSLKLGCSTPANAGALRGASGGITWWPCA